MHMPEYSLLMVIIRRFVFMFVMFLYIYSDYLLHIVGFFSKPHATKQIFLYTDIQIIYNHVHIRSLLLILYQYPNINILKLHLKFSSLAVILIIV